jgi:hypothetical protein
MSFMTPVTEIEKQVCTNQPKKRNVRPRHPIEVVKNLMDYPEDITKEYQQHEHQAFPLRRL